ncbi:MAG: hypothetical protein RIF36_04555, partial [Imperialibacter sp.]|uniref:hypothetical protein n=1 Tax=Imperialibacter sp. TaxID=2038411 RepID=UPI0032EAC97C
MKFFFLTGTFLWHFASLAICPSVSIDSIDGALCRNEQLPLSYSVENFSDFFWDFCADELTVTPSSTKVSTLSGSSRPLGVSVVESSGIWYLFATSRDNNKLFRYTYGNGLQSAATSVDDLGT